MQAFTNTDTEKWLFNLDKRMRQIAGLLITNGGVGSNFISFTVGGSGSPTPPVNGATTYTNTAFIGKTPRIFLNGNGLLLEGTDYTFNSVTGLITLINSRTFNTGEVYAIFY